MFEAIDDRFEHNTITTHLETQRDVVSGTTLNDSEHRTDDIVITARRFAASDGETH